MKRVLNNLEEYLIAVFLPAMCLIVFVNTVGRYTGALSIPWAEEAARYLMIWLVFLGIAAAAKHNSHFAVEVLFLLTPKGFHKYARYLISVVVILFCLTVSMLAFKFVGNLHRMGQVSPSLGIPMWLMYSSIPIGCSLMAVRTLQCYAQDKWPLYTGTILGIIVCYLAVLFGPQWLLKNEIISEAGLQTARYAVNAAAAVISVICMAIYLRSAKEEAWDPEAAALAEAGACENELEDKPGPDGK